MIIQPKVRGFICVTAHPEGCASHVREQISYVSSRGAIRNGPKRALIIGSSTGYGLSSRIAAAFGCGADTAGVFFERPASNGKPASAGWYNTAAFTQEAEKAGLKALNFNGDAFSDSMKQQVLAALKERLGPIDLVIYSLASPRRTHPKTGATHRSVLKPIAAPFSSKTLDTDRKAVTEVTIEPATEQEIDDTVAVMGGEDWRMWIEALDREGLLADGARTAAYDYIGPDVTWPIYKNGSIGQAKKHLNATARELDARLREKGGRAFVSVNKAVVTQASSAIPVVPLYISILFRVMKGLGLHEDTIEQIDRLLRERLLEENPPVDEGGRIRVDDWEMKPEVQEAVKALWPQVTTENLQETTDFSGYQQDFLKLFGFGLGGVDYEADVEEQRPIPGID